MEGQLDRRCDLELSVEQVGRLGDDHRRRDERACRSFEQLHPGNVLAVVSIGCGHE